MFRVTQQAANFQRDRSRGRSVDGCLNPPEFGDMGSAAVAGSD
jgi:hypothetical protein